MNYRGSYKKLLENSRAAMMAAIEIYNKPSFHYRDECVVILLLNAWELLLKAILSKNRQSIFYPKKRKQPYRTLSCQDAFHRAKAVFPSGTQALAVQRNIELLGTYRDNAVHFYNAAGFGSVVYALAQTCIVNFRDLIQAAFNEQLEEEITWCILPIGVRAPVNVVEYLKGGETGDSKQSKAVKQFLNALAEATEEVRKAGQDTGKLLTVFNVKLESVKKIGQADVVVGVQPSGEGDGPLAIIKTQDPNVSHPLRQRDVIDSIGPLHGLSFTSHVFQAVAWKHNLKEKSQFCWQAKEGVLTKWSRDVITFIKSLSKADVTAAIEDYKQYLRSRRRRTTGSSS
jgi:hypothetical protein